MRIQKKIKIQTARMNRLKKSRKSLKIRSHRARLRKLIKMKKTASSKVEARERKEKTRLRSKEGVLNREHKATMRKNSCPNRKSIRALIKRQPSSLKRSPYSKMCNHCQRKKRKIKY